VVGIGCAGLGALVLGRLLIRKAIGVGRAAPDRPCDDDSAFRKRNFRAAVAGAMVVAIAAGACFWQTFKPLSPVGLGHRAAARWLAARPEPARTVVDTQGWMGLYSGWSTRGFAIGPAVFADPNLAYVVLERNEIQRSSSRSRTLRELLETAGQPVAVFPGPPSDKLSHDVLVYRWNAERLLRWATVRRTARPGAPARPSSNGPLSRVPGPPRAGRRPTGPGNLS
jgi:hypothetical protein